jgi:hypothetical protein
MRPRLLSSDEKYDVPDESRRWYWVAPVLIIIGAGVIRCQLLPIPLERDEGEYAYVAQQMLKGVPPYESAYSMKLPGIYAVYALILAVFGQTHIAIHLGLLLVNAGTILAVFWLTKRMFGMLAGVAAAAVYAVISLGAPVQGFIANAEHFVVLPAIVGLALIDKAAERRNWLVVFFAAILLGLSFIIKQHGIFFVLFGGLYQLYCELRHRPVSWMGLVVRQFIFTLGAVLPFVVTCVILKRAGVFDNFWFWTFTYARRYVTTIPLSMARGLFRAQSEVLFIETILIWLFAVLGVVVVLVRGRGRGCVVFTIGFMVFSILSVCPGFYFRRHYFILLLPAVAILAGVGFAGILTLLPRHIFGFSRGLVIAIAGMAVVGFTLFQQRVYLFYLSPVEVCRLLYGNNPFPESLQIGRFIRENTAPGDTIVVIGSEPQIYFYSDRRSASGHIYTFPMMVRHDYAENMQLQMIGEIESVKPELIVYLGNPGFIAYPPGSIAGLLDWARGYIKEFYTRVGVVEIPPDGQTIYRWNEKQAGYVPVFRDWIGVYKRRRADTDDDRRKR